MSIGTEIFDFGSGERISPRQSVIDCDLHPGQPSVPDLMPYMPEYWREHVVIRGIDRYGFTLTSAVPDALSAVAAASRSPARKRGMVAAVKEDVLDRLGIDFAILNCPHGALAVHNDDMAAAFAAAINEWLVHEWLTKDSRLRACITIPLENAELAVEEIERRVADSRFVAILMMAMGERPLGKRSYRPIFAAAERHGLPLLIHAGGSARHAPTSMGWPTYALEDAVNQSGAFEGQLLSLVSEGVFTKFPKLKIVLAESGFCWLPALFWRANKTWRGVRIEVPWLNEPPSEIIRRHVRLTLRPICGPPTSDQLAHVLKQLGSDDMLLFSTDYPRQILDDDALLPQAFEGHLARKVLWDNPADTFQRLRIAKS